MATFRMTVKMDNAAFADEGPSYELRRILEQAAKDVMDADAQPGSDGTLRDVNGNTVGNWKVTA